MKGQWKKLFTRKDCDVMTFCGVLTTAYQEIWQQTKKHQEYLFGHFKDKHFNYYLNELDERQIGRKFYKRYYSSPQQIISAHRLGKRFLKQTKIKTRKWQELLKHSNSLLPAFNDFRKDFDFVNFNYSIMPWWALEAWQHDFEDLVNDLITKRGLSEKYELIISSLLKPWKITAIVNVGKEVAKGKPISQLVKKYQFLRTWTVLWYKPITVEWIKSASQPKTEKLLSKEQLIKLLKPTQQQRAYFAMAPYMIFLKDWRDDLRRQQVYDWNFLFQRIARHLRVKYDDLGYFTFDELAEAIEKSKLKSDRLRARRDKEFILTVRLDQLRMRVIEGVPPKYRKAIDQAESVGVVKQINGIIAQPGITIGAVRIIRSVHDLKKIEAGEILVTNTTHPNYLSAMQKAAAFVTNEGGIVSHASIVARELKKPCIVGTKIATKVLKDGDIVEVDAQRGIVRKIK